VVATLRVGTVVAKAIELVDEELKQVLAVEGGLRGRRKRA
jgi:hypothetical protein